MTSKKICFINKVNYKDSATNKAHDKDMFNPNFFETCRLSIKLLSISKSLYKLRIGFPYTL